MSVSSRYNRPRFAFDTLGMAGALLLAIGMMACGAGRLTTDRAYSELKPKEQLPEREQRQLPENLLIKIENVADAGHSYGNYAVLYINGREVTPLEKLSNFTSKYTYPLRLQPGVYDVRAEYHVIGFWREQVFDIKTDEPVKVMPDERTVMNVRLDKDNRGRPLQKPLQFQMRYESLAEVTQPAVPVQYSSSPTVSAPLVRELSSEKPLVSQPQPIMTPPEQLSLPAAKPVLQAPEETMSAPSARTVTLQINTAPSGADVIVDDRYVGQSPLKVRVTADQNHVLQISRSGHEEVMKVLDVKELQDQTLVQYLIKLEAVVKQ